LAVYLLARVADAVWFRAARPADFADANWAGEWRTAQYWGLTGRVLVRLPDPLPVNTDFKAEALVYYPVCSLWKPGRFVRMDFTGHFSPDAPASAGRTTNEIPGGKLKFKDVAGDQVVEYAAVIDGGRTVVSGGYLSRSPHDYGSFWVERE
jgi:hypothetical protein